MMKSKKRFMVVDDDATNNMICQFNIKRFDKEADIKIFNIPEDALAFIRDDYSLVIAEIPTVLFLDINMPSMTGWEVLDEFMQLDDFVKNQFTIYILSSSIENFKEKADIYKDIKGFLSKPLKLSDLEKVMMDQQEYELD